MSDILERVQGARQTALKIFLKEYATNNFAKFIVESKEVFDETISSMGMLDPFEISDKKTRERLLESLYRRIFIDGAGVRDNFSIRFEEGIKSNRSLHDLFVSLRQHLGAADKIISTSKRMDSTDLDKERAVPVKRHMDGIFDAAIARAGDIHIKIMKEKSGNGWKPELLVLQGGGAKGMSYAGVIQSMQDSGMLSNIKMVAGTSAGALLGVLVSMGYTAEEITDVVNKGRFAQFFAETTTKFKGLMKVKSFFSKTEPVKTPFYEGNLLADFAADHFLPALESATDISIKKWSTFSEKIVQDSLRSLEKGWNPLISKQDSSNQITLETIYNVAVESFRKKLASEGRESDLDILQFSGIGERSKEYQAAITCIRFKRPRSLEDGDTIEAFIGDAIQYKVEQLPIMVLNNLQPPINTLSEIRNITFDQLRQLAEEYPNGGFKELGVAATISYAPVSFSNIGSFLNRVIERASQGLNLKSPAEIAEEDKRFSFKPIFFRSYVDESKSRESNKPIKKAVRASMNLPFLFKAMALNGKRVIDGGVNSNYPHRIFADRFASMEEAEEKTIGFMLSTLETDIEMKAIGHLIGNKSAWIDKMLEEESFSQKIVSLAKNIRHPIEFTKKLIKKAMSSQIEGFMRRNNSLPSLEAMDNVGIINTGTIGTADFNASVREKILLAAQGSNAFLDLTNLHSDKRLRYAMGRLVSLSAIENKLLQEQGLDANLEDPIHQIRDPDLLAESLLDEKYQAWELDDLILKKPDISSRINKKPASDFESYAFDK